MAVIEQDNFSNISWQSEQRGGASSSGAMSADEPTSDLVGGSGRDEQEPQPNYERMDGANLVGWETLECTVSSPLKENEGGRDSFTSYLITTTVRTVALFAAGSRSIRPQRRRFSTL